MPPFINFKGRDFTLQEIFNEIAVDTDGDGKPDAIALVNPDGSILMAGACLTDELVKASSGDPTAGYLDAKVDGTTVEVASNLLKVKDGVYILVSAKGAANGVAPLDGASKIPIANLPASVFLYKGMWDASTNTPTLADGTGVGGWIYRVNVAGSQDLGSGTLVFTIGDYVIHNGSTWEKADANDQVISVNTKNGVVVLNPDDLDDVATAHKFISAAQLSDLAANTAARHAILHAITSTSDHSAGNHKLFYSDDSGNLVELVHGATGKVLKSNGPAVAPSWEDEAGGSKPDYVIKRRGMLWRKPSHQGCHFPSL